MSDSNTISVHYAVPSNDAVSEMLRNLTREIDARGLAERGAGALGGVYGYGCDYENDVFLMHRYCWCDEPDCKWCDGTNPNFWHKPTGIRVRWYKYIGRCMEIELHGAPFDVADVYRSAVGSLPS